MANEVKCRHCGNGWNSQECKCVAHQECGGKGCDGCELVDDKPHHSPTSLELLFKCGEAYRRRYVEGERIPPGVAMLRGGGVHRGVEANFSQKVESFRDLPTAEVVEISVESFNAKWEREGVELTAEEKSVGVAKTKNATTRVVKSLSELFHEKAAPRYQPTRVEEGFRLVLPGSHDLVGFLDVIAHDRHDPDEVKRVVDVKTAAKKKSLADVDGSLQLTAYAAGACVLEDEVEIDVRLEVAVATKTPKIQSVQSHRDYVDFKALENRIEVATSIIGHGDFQPAAIGAWWCSPKWCGYWSTCPYVNADRKGACEI